MFTRIYSIKILGFLFILFLIVSINLAGNAGLNISFAEQSCDFDFDFDGDGDVDGYDLAEFISTGGIDFEGFALEFGRNNCSKGIWVIDPNGGEKLTAGTWFDIKWNGISGITNVDIELSLDSGDSYPITIVRNTPSDGGFKWGPVPYHDLQESINSCRIKIKDSANPETVFDESKDDFTILPAPASTPMTLRTLYEMNKMLKSDLAADGPQDSDNDGLFDSVEIYLGTDPSHRDTDRDGYSDFYELFGDGTIIPPGAPLTDQDRDGIIKPLDNDDDGDGENDGRGLDSDNDGIPNYLEVYGYTYDSTQGYYSPWDEDVTVDYYKSDPLQTTSDADHYSDSMEASGLQMDRSVVGPGDHPMIPAFPNITVRLKGYDYYLNSEITQTDGTVHEIDSEWDAETHNSTSKTDEWYQEVGVEASTSFSPTGLGGGVTVHANYGESHSNTYTNGTVRSNGGGMMDASEWSLATCTNPSDAARIELTLEATNIGTCVAKDIEFDLNLKIGDKLVETIDDVNTIDSLAPGGSYTFIVNKDNDGNDIVLPFEDLRALETGAPVTIEIPSSSLNLTVMRKDENGFTAVLNWKDYMREAEAVCAHLYLDLGDGNTTEHLVYADDADSAPVVTFRDAIIWAANGRDDPLNGPVVEFYQPDGSLGLPAPLDGWYFSLDAETYQNVSNYVHSDPGFNLFDVVLTPHSVVVAKAPPIEPTPQVKWTVVSPRDGIVKAFVEDYFFNQHRLTVMFIDKNGVEHPMTWNPADMYYSWSCPKDYFMDSSEKIIARNPMYGTSSTPDDWETEMPASEMTYIRGYANPYLVGSVVRKAMGVFVFGDYAYIADGQAGLQIMNISDPTSPVMAGFIDTPGAAKNVYVSGSYAYLAAGDAGLQIINISDPSNPTVAGEIDTPGHSYAVAVSGNYAYVADGQAGLQIIDVGDPGSLEIVGSVYTANAVNITLSGQFAYVADRWAGLRIIDISDPTAPTLAGGTPAWAAEVAVSGNYAFVAVVSSGLLVIDISVPNNPQIVGSVDTPGYAYGIHITGSYAYVADGGSGLQVINITEPKSPTVIAAIDTLGALGDAIDVFVDGGFAYVADGHNGLQVIDISELIHAVEVGSFPMAAVNDVYVQGDYAYVADSRYLSRFDISNPEVPPVYIWTWDLFEKINSVYLSGSYAYVARNDGSFHIYDPNNPNPIGYIATSATPAHSVFVSEPYAYVAVGSEGLKVINITNPAIPAIAGMVDTPGYAYDVAISGNYAYVADNLFGLQVIDISNPNTPQIVGSVDTPGAASDVAISGNYAYVGDEASGLQIIDISDPTDPVIKGSVDTPGPAYEVALYGNFAIVADGPSGLQIIDISNPNTPQIVGSVDTQGSAVGIHISGNHAYVADWNGGLRIMELEEGLKIIGADKAHGTARNVSISDDLAYVADGEGGLQVIDIFDPVNPVIVGWVDTPGYALDLAIDDRGYVYVADGAGGLTVIDISDPINPSWVGSFDTVGKAISVYISDNYAYVGDEINRLQLFDISSPEIPVLADNIPDIGGARDVYVSENSAFWVDYEYGFYITDVSDKQNLVSVGDVPTPGAAMGVYVSGDYAYVADSYNGLQVIDITNTGFPVIVDDIDTDGRSFDVHVSGQYAFISDGSNGLVVIDISNKADPDKEMEQRSSLDTSGIAVGLDFTDSQAFVADGFGGFKIIGFK